MNVVAPGSGSLDWALAIFDPNRRQTPRLEAHGFVTYEKHRVLSHTTNLSVIVLWEM